MNKKYCLTLDLKDDEDLIKEYEHLHQKIPSVIQKSITDSGIINMEIYRVANRKRMIPLALRKNQAWIKQMLMCRHGKI